jgi:inosine-uridine nucleoside N-ribohydrolase
MANIFWHVFAQTGLLLPSPEFNFHCDVEAVQVVLQKVRLSASALNLLCWVFDIH